MRLSLIVILLYPVVQISYSQSIETHNLTWQVISFHNHSNNEDVTLASRFETSPQLVKWIQKNGSVVYEFNITGKSGTWMNINNDGEFEMTVSFRDSTGTILFKRDQGVISITINIIKDGQALLPYTFKVSSISTQ